MDGVVALVAVEDTLDLAGGHGGGNGPGGLGVVGLPGGVIVHSLKIHRSTGFSGGLGCDHHSRRPLSWRVDWTLFYDS